MKRLFLLFHGRFPSEKAASLFTAKNAETFASHGFEVILIVPKRRGAPQDNPFVFYGIKEGFRIVYVPIIDLFEHKIFKKLSFVLSVMSFSWGVFWFLKGKVKQEDIVYSNEVQPLFLASFLSDKCFYEMHDFPESKLHLFGYAMNRMRWILIHNKWKLEEAKKHFPYISHKTFLCEPNAVDPKDFDISMSTIEAREKLGLPLDKKIVVYTGHLYGWKGVDVLAEASMLTPGNYLVVFVGGTGKDVESFTKKYGKSKRLMIVGHKPHRDMPIWQKAADVLVLPNTAKEKISAYYTSPMKLFEYMASKKPIIASDIPSIREVVDDKCVLFVPPDDAKLLADAIVKVLFADTKAMSSEAFRVAGLHTWDKRADRIISFINGGGNDSFLSYKVKILLVVRYLFSGFLAFGTNLGLLFVFKHYLNWWYLTASTVAFIASVVVSFLAQKFITFRDNSKNRVPHQLFRYVTIALFNVTVNGVFMYSLVDVIHLSYLLSQIVSAGIIAVYSLFIYRFVVFSHATIR